MSQCQYCKILHPLEFINVWIRQRSIPVIPSTKYIHITIVHEIFSHITLLFHLSSSPPTKSAIPTLTEFLDDGIANLGRQVVPLCRQGAQPLHPRLRARAVEIGTAGQRTGGVPAAHRLAATGVANASSQRHLILAQSVLRGLTAAERPALVARLDDLLAHGARMRPELSPAAFCRKEEEGG